VKKLGNHARLYPAFVDCRLDALRKYLEEIDTVTRDVRLSDGNVTPDFIRTVLLPRVFSAIAAQKGAIQHELELTRMRTQDHNSGASHYLIERINHLQGELAARYEAEAIECGKRAARTQIANASGPVSLSTVPSSPSGGLKALDYPSDFPPDARDRIEEMKIRASRELLPSSVYEFKDQDLAIRCILRIFLAFAKEACALRQKLAWPMDRLQREAEEFLRRVSIAIIFAKFPGLDRFWISNWNGSISADVERRFKSSSEWTEYEELLLASSPSLKSGGTTQRLESNVAEETRKRGGRPRKDHERDLVRKLKAEGATWKEIARKMNAETNQEKTPEAYRALLKGGPTTPTFPGKNGQN
jgi:hypothetical protein